jgi:site-specific DNA recombinase
MPRKSSVPSLASGVARPCALVRVSSEEQVDQFSLPMQVHKIEEYCHQQLDAELPESAIFREEGVSGRPGTLKKRPGLSAAIEACLAGRYSHLVVHKLDRLGRNVGLVSTVLEQLDQHGIVFVSVQDRVDASTAAGRLYIAIFIAIAQWYSDNLSEETRKGKEGRRRAGLYNGILPFGVVRGEGTQAAPLPDLRPLELVGSDGVTRHLFNHAGLLLAFTLCGQGLSAREIAMQLNTLGYRTHGTWGSNPFSKDTVQHMLGNRFYLGELPDGQGGWVPGKHSALIPQELWDVAQRARARQRRNPQTIPGHARVHVLGGGLLRCGTCWMQERSSALHVAKSRKADDTAYYSCYGRFQGYPCTQPSIPDKHLEAQLDYFFAAFTLPEDLQQRLLALYEEERGRMLPAASQGPTSAQRRVQLEARLERQRHLYELGDWSRDSYLEARQGILAELAELDMETPPAESEHEADAIARLCAYVRELGVAWRDADKPNKRLLVRTLFEQLWVIGDRIVAAKPVAQFAPFLRLIRNLHGDDPDERLYLAPGILSAWNDQDIEAEAEQVGKVAKEIAHNLDGHGLSRAVRTGGPDGVRTRDLRRDRPAC